MSDAETKNAEIKSATITNDDHGILTAWLTLDYGGTCQGFGGVVLYAPESLRNPSQEDSRAKRNPAGHFIWRVLEVAGVTEWSQLVGRTIRVRCSWNAVEAIGHILKDDWFEPAKDFGWPGR